MAKRTAVKIPPEVVRASELIQAQIDEASKPVSDGMYGTNGQDSGRILALTEAQAILFRACQEVASEADQ